MKKLLYLLLILPLLSISCSSDNDDVNTGAETGTENYSNSDIVGTWVLKSSVAKEVKTNNDSVTQIIKDMVKYEFTNELPITFIPDGKMELYYNPDSIITGTYSINGNKLIMDSPLKENPYSEISISGDTWYQYLDETNTYKEEILNLYPDAKDIVVSKVISTYIYKKQ